MTKMVDLVIRIPEETYKSIIESDIEVEFYRSAEVFYSPISIMLAIRTGKVLPKGHGRLIDADKLHHCECRGNFSECDTCLDDVLCNLVNEAPTIIEADKEGAEE